MSEITQDLITKELVICDAFGELRLKPILFEKNVEYGTNKIIDLLNDLQQENQQLKSVLNEVREILSQGITFCKNDSQGAYDVCNITINREKKILEILDKVGDK